MKRFFLSVMLLLAVSLSAFSQVKVSSGNTSVDVSVKRALAVGDDVVIDFVITCHNKWTKIQLLGQDDGVWAPIVFDDEGNVYKGTGMTGRLAYEVDGKRAYYV